MQKDNKQTLGNFLLVKLWCLKWLNYHWQLRTLYIQDGNSSLPSVCQQMISGGIEHLKVDINELGVRFEHHGGSQANSHPLNYLNDDTKHGTVFQHPICSMGYKRRYETQKGISTPHLFYGV